jgi:hypothetical protein
VQIWPSDQRRTRQIRPLLKTNRYLTSALGSESNGPDHGCGNECARLIWVVRGSIYGPYLITRRGYPRFNHSRSLAYRWFWHLFFLWPRTVAARTHQRRQSRRSACDSVIPGYYFQIRKLLRDVELMASMRAEVLTGCRGVESTRPWAVRPAVEDPPNEKFVAPGCSHGPAVAPPWNSCPGEAPKPPVEAQTTVYPGLQCNSGGVVWSTAPIDFAASPLPETDASDGGGRGSRHGFIAGDGDELGQATRWVREILADSAALAVRSSRAFVTVRGKGWHVGPKRQWQRKGASECAEEGLQVGPDTSDQTSTEARRRLWLC